MTFEPWKDGAFLIRFEHLLEKNEDPELSKTVRFNLSDVFPGMVVELQEVILSANQWIEQLQRLHFRPDSADFSMNAESNLQPVIDNEITLEPMQIRTFIMSLYPRV
jgi:hypothetical protein